jgi:hypothetical protein
MYRFGLWPLRRTPRSCIARWVLYRKNRRRLSKLVIQPQFRERVTSYNGESLGCHRAVWFGGSLLGPCDELDYSTQVSAQGMVEGIRDFSTPRTSSLGFALSFSRNLLGRPAGRARSILRGEGGAISVPVFLRVWVSCILLSYM